MPRLRDAYISRLQDYASALNTRSMIDTDYISAQLQAATDQVLGRTDAKGVMGSILLNWAAVSAFFALHTRGKGGIDSSGWPP